MPDLTCLDLVVYAYVKEELVNTPQSTETLYLKNHFKNLVKFIEFID